ncbi:MAG TPA: hypothetical protein VFC74_10265 [Oscillospiraceae bacterium]|nr:hypothetical protein [Oscillospiraceae bacterium]
MKLGQLKKITLLLLAVLFFLTGCVDLSNSDPEALGVLGYTDPNFWATQSAVPISITANEGGTASGAGWSNETDEGIYADSAELVAATTLGSSVNVATETTGKNLVLLSESGEVTVPLTNIGALGDNYDALANIETVKAALQADLNAAFPKTNPAALTFTV